MSLARAASALLEPWQPRDLVTVNEAVVRLGFRRFYADDPLGNRLEFLEAQPSTG